MEVISDVLPLSFHQTWLLGAVIFLVGYNYMTKQSWRNLPPGPLSLPVVGSLPFLGMKMEKSLRQMAAKYGDVFTIYMGSQRVVVLNGFDTIQEAMIKNANLFSGRPKNHSILNLTFSGVVGVITDDGDSWRDMRRNTLRVLRDFGMGRNIMEARILDEISTLMVELKKSVGKPLNPMMLLATSLANIMATITFGKNYDYDDPIFQQYIKILIENSQDVGIQGLLFPFPFLSSLPGDLFRVKKLGKDMQFLKDEQQRQIDEHKKTWEECNEPSDVVEAFLPKLMSEEGNTDHITGAQLAGLVFDLFIAGTLTTSTTISWAILYMTLDQQLQARVHKEIDGVIMNGDEPKYEHRNRLPLSEACIFESQRLADLVPFSVPHRVTEDCTFRNYNIPKDTMVWPNLNSVHRDPHLWPNPEEFRPERFLDGEGKAKKVAELIPFGMGKRQCLGEGVAKMELFLFFTSLMKNFRFLPAPGHPLSSKDVNEGILKTPKYFHIIMEIRN